ncbi:MAG: glycosyltransferase [Acidiferrobacterales bacterium]
MNILMFTNTFTPHVGGVARSVQGFTKEFRERGHRVVVAAPYFENTPDREADVIRFPAVQHFNGSDFSVPVPVPGRLYTALKTFHPDIVHSHHPFLLGDTALRVAAARNIPVVFTHHTLYEEYTHYVPGDSPTLKRFAVDLAIGYCNLCDAVVAPSQTVADLLVGRGTAVPIEIIPTGVDRAVFAKGDGRAARKRFGIPTDAFVVGHTGRLAPEKNPRFLAEAVAQFLLSNEHCHFLVAGAGPSMQEIQAIFERRGLAGRLHLAGVMGHPELAGAYRAMNVFAFSSHTETQGMVLTEAMAAGVPVVAVDASGVREVVRDGVNGRLLPADNPDSFSAALSWVAALSPQANQRLQQAIARTAEEFSMPRTTARVLALYESLINSAPATREIETSPWASARRRIEEEWKIIRNIARAVGDSVLSAPRPQKR